MKKKTSADQMTLSGSEEEILTRLNDRVEKAIATIQELRRERDDLKRRLAEAEQQPREDERVEELERERGEIRNRIESILTALESLDG